MTIGRPARLVVVAWMLAVVMLASCSSPPGDADGAGLSGTGGAAPSGRTATASTAAVTDPRPSPAQPGSRRTPPASRADTSSDVVPSGITAPTSRRHAAPGSPAPPGGGTTGGTALGAASGARPGAPPSGMPPTGTGRPGGAPAAGSPTPGTGGLPAVSLAGVNDAACRSADPPVVLLHGTFSTVALNFSALVPALLRDGRCVYGLNYGRDGVDAITSSAAAVTSFVGEVRARTGAARVDVVAYSQGGLVLRAALRLDGLAPSVRVAVLIAPSFHGTTSPLATVLPGGLCPACADQAAGSALLRRLDAGGDLDGSVRYAVVSTTDDAVVTPVASQVPRGPASRVRAVTVQQRCPGARVDHVALPGYPGVVRWVIAALHTDGRPPADALTCG